MRQRARYLLAALITMAAGAAHAADERCYTTWSEAAPVVRAQGLLDMETLIARATPGHLGGELVKTTLCNVQGRFIYRLVVREAKGRLRMVAIDAHKPVAH